jgi:hypothetical protein
MATTGTSQASDEFDDCTTTGASGWVSADWRGSITEIVDVGLGVADTSADGHHVAVRLMTHDSGGDIRYWSWHHWSEGNDTSNTWYTTAQDSNSGIRDVGVQVGRFEGSTLLNSCKSW